MATIDPAEVRRIAELARLELDPPTRTALGADLTSILDYVALLDEVDVRTIRPTSDAIDAARPLREDEPQRSLSQQEALANAPEQSSGHFRVPRILTG